MERFLPDYCGGAPVGGGCAGLSPPPNIFCRKFFFFGGFCSVVPGGCGFEGVALGLEVPFPNSPCIRVCGDSPMWLQLLVGTVPSRNATE
jgi:hypothetical protein